MFGGIGQRARVLAAVALGASRVVALGRRAQALAPLVELGGVDLAIDWAGSAQGLQCTVVSGEGERRWG
jgi:threonine dehydrogenase-like Zn-dependent dehydrogenase